jgi:hypothetical protein
MTKPLIPLVAGLASALWACGSTDDDDARVGPHEPGAEAVPDTGPGTGGPTLPENADLVTYEVGDIEVAAGEEKITCHYLDALPDDLYMVRMTTRQQSTGHHIVLYRNIGEAKPVGSQDDCSDVETTRLLVATPYAQEGEKAWVDFPEGHALQIPADSQLIVENHYINTTSEAIQPVDQIELTVVPRDSVEFPVFTFVSAPYPIEIPPGTRTTFRYDCPIDFSMTVVSIFPHMHEAGLAYSCEMGAFEDPRSVIHLPDWNPEWRSVPPITTFEAGDPAARFGPGDVQRASCTIGNTTGEVRGLPEEMCATVTFFTSEDPDADHGLCAVEAEVELEPL